jgi:hypothetical protein
MLYAGDLTMVILLRSSPQTRAEQFRDDLRTHLAACHDDLSTHKDLPRSQTAEEYDICPLPTIDNRTPLAFGAVVLAPVVGLSSVTMLGYSFSASVTRLGAIHISEF